MEAVYRRAIAYSYPEKATYSNLLLSIARGFNEGAGGYVLYDQIEQNSTGEQFLKHFPDRWFICPEDYQGEIEKIQNPDIPLEINDPLLTMLYKEGQLLAKKLNSGTFNSGHILMALVHYGMEDPDFKVVLDDLKLEEKSIVEMLKRVN